MCKFFPDRTSFRSAFAEIKAAAGTTFRVKCESVHYVPAVFDFLDMSVNFCGPHPEIVASQKKPVIPLDASSSHNPGVHKSWPSAVAHRVCTLNSDTSNSFSPLDLLYERYRNANAHPYTLCQLNNIRLITPKSRSLKGSHGSSQTVHTAVMRFHPLFRRAFSCAMRAVPPPDELNLKLRAGWRNALHSVSTFVNRNNTRIIGGHFPSSDSSAFRDRK